MTGYEASFLFKEYEEIKDSYNTSFYKLLRIQTWEYKHSKKVE